MTQPLPLLMTGSEWFTSRPGGLNRYFYELFHAMSRADGVAATAAAFGEAPAIPGATSWNADRNLLARIRGSRRRPADVSPAVVDRHFALYGPPARAYPSALQIVHFQGPWAGESQVAGGAGWNVRAKRAVERRRYAEADHLIVLSEPFAEILVSQYGISRDRISVLPPGVDVQRFAPAASEGEPDRSAGRPIVLCVRRLEQRMGIDVLIRAWDDILRSVPEAELRIVGTGTYEETLREMASRTSNPGSITFTGRLSDAELIEEYRASDITVVPTTQLEGFGLIALESLAAGRAPVVTDCGGLPDAVRGLDASLIVPPGDEAALADRISRALRGERPSAVECTEHAATFSWDATAQRHLALYRRLSA